MYIDDFSAGLELEGCVAALWEGRRAAKLMKGGCGERVQWSCLLPGKDVKGKEGNGLSLCSSWGGRSAETVSLPGFDAVGLMEKMLFS